MNTRVTHGSIVRPSSHDPHHSQSQRNYFTIPHPYTPVQPIRRVWTLASPHESELEAKKSKFLAFAWPVSTPAEAKEAIRSRFDPRASHNCTAFRIGSEYHFNDDGEPSGTAGRPILSAIEAEDLHGVVVLVVRYFGGTKLGTGGLVRAYGGAARQCLQEAPRVFVPRRARPHLKLLTIELPPKLCPSAFGLYATGASVCSPIYFHTHCAVWTLHMHAPM